MSLGVIIGVFFILLLISVMILLIIFRIIKKENEPANEMLELARAQVQMVLTTHDYLDEHLSIIEALRKRVEQIESEKNVYRKW